MATPKAIDDRIRIPKNFPKKQTLSLLQLYAELREANLGAELFPTICARITSLYPDALTPFTVDSLKQRVEYCLAEGIKGTAARYVKEALEQLGLSPGRPSSAIARSRGLRRPELPPASVAPNAIEDDDEDRKSRLERLFEAFPEPEPRNRDAKRPFNQVTPMVLDLRFPTASTAKILFVETLIRNVADESGKVHGEVNVLVETLSNWTVQLAYTAGSNLVTLEFVIPKIVVIGGDSHSPQEYLRRAGMTHFPFKLEILLPRPVHMEKEGVKQEIPPPDRGNPQIIYTLPLSEKIDDSGWIRPTTTKIL